MVANGNTQRIEQSEQRMAELHGSLSQEVESVVSKAMLVFQQTLTAHIVDSLEKANQKLAQEFTSLVLSHID